MSAAREATPEEWAANLLDGSEELTKERLAISIRTAIRRGWFQAVLAAVYAVEDEATKKVIRDLYNKAPAEAELQKPEA